MTKVYLLDKDTTSWNIKTDEELEKYFFFITTESLSCGEAFEYNGKYYTISSGRPKENIVFCREFFYAGDEETALEGEITCPYCNATDGDSFERGGGEDSEVCSTCGSVFSWEVEITYVSTSKKFHKLKQVESLKNNEKI